MSQISYFFYSSTSIKKWSCLSVKSNSSPLSEGKNIRSLFMQSYVLFIQYLVIYDWVIQCKLAFSVVKYIPLDLFTILLSIMPSSSDGFSKSFPNSDFDQTRINARQNNTKNPWPLKYDNSTILNSIERKKYSWDDIIHTELSNFVNT